MPASFAHRNEGSRRAGTSDAQLEFAGVKMTCATALEQCEDHTSITPALLKSRGTHHGTPATHAGFIGHCLHFLYEYITAGRHSPRDFTPGAAG